MTCRQRFIEVASKFSKECRYVLEILGEVENHDAFCWEPGMLPEEHPVYHQTHSGPRWKRINASGNSLRSARSKPNSGLGRAITCM